jgi:hypothetical protein
MDIDLKPFLDRYEKVSAQADAAFKHVSEAHPELVRCKKGCSDCCYALFDLTLIEALSGLIGRPTVLNEKHLKMLRVEKMK